MYSKATIVCHNWVLITPIPATRDHRKTKANNNAYKRCTRSKHRNYVTTVLQPATAIFIHLPRPSPDPNKQPALARKDCNVYVSIDYIVLDKGINSHSCTEN